MLINIDGHILQGIVMDTPLKRKKGLIGVPEEDLMRKVYIFPGSNVCTMQDMDYPIMLLFYKGNVIIDVIQAFPGEVYNNSNADGFMEMLPGRQIRNNCIVKTMGNKKDYFSDENPTMLVLDHKGNPQMGFTSGTLVISRKETKELIDLASETDDDNEKDLLKLGKMMYDIRTKQKKRDKK